jgi:membrane-associated phospholipid phosphatase
MTSETLKNNRSFLFPFAALFLLVSLILLSDTKAGIHLWLNNFHSVFFDWFFKYITHLGDGLFIIIPVVVMLFFSLRNSLFILTAYLSTGLITQLMKRLVFDGAERPIRYFQDIAQLHLVDGVHMLSGHSFPSGHATSAFAMFLCLALITRNRWIQFSCFIAACLVSFSRVYLSQHFLIDVYTGALIGITGTLMIYPLFFGRDRNWHHWSIIKPFRHG